MSAPDPKEAWQRIQNELTRRTSRLGGSGGGGGGLGRVGGTVVAIDAPRAAALGVGHAPTDTPEVRRVALGFDERVPEHLKANLRQAREKA